MGDIPQKNDASKEDPAPLRNKFFDNFLGCYTQASRTALPDGYFYNLENIIPIGSQNAHVVPNISSALVNYAADTIYWSQGVNLNGTEYLVNFSTTGKVFFYNIAAATSAQVNSGHSLSGSGSRCDQWQNTVILFIDSTGYYSYDGTTFSPITGSGVPTSGNDIAVYSGYVWIVSGRTLYTSAINSYTDWTSADGAQITVLIDPQLRGTVQRLKAQNGYLYLIANVGINAIADVNIPAGASPPTPQFSNQNIQALIGSDQPGSVFAYDRNLMFASRYGTHSLYGVSAPKVSGDIDGTWQYVDFTQPISGGQVVVENILCSAFLIKRKNDPTFGSSTVVALWFQNTDTSPQTGVTETTDIWWFANTDTVGPLTLISSGILNNTPTLFGFIGNQLYQLFADPTTAPTINVMTAQWQLDDPLARKECITAGFGAFYNIYGSEISLSLDSDNISTPLVVNTNFGTGNWVNSFSVQGLWINAASQTGQWLGSGVFLSLADAQGGFGRYNGLTLDATGYQFQLNYLALDYKIRDRWL